MKNKLIKSIILLILLIITILAVQATVSSYLIKYATGVISGGSSELATLTQLAMGASPSSLLTQQVLGTLPPTIQQAYNLKTNPAGAVQSEAFRLLQQQNPKVANAITKFQNYKSKIDEIKEDNRPIVSISENGQTTFIDKKTGQPLLVLGSNSAWDVSAINKNTEEINLVRKKADLKNYNSKCAELKKRNNCDPLIVRGAEINLGNEEGEVTFKFDKTNGNSIINIKRGSADINVEGSELKKVSQGQIKTFTGANGKSEIVYASFTAAEDSSNKIVYSGNEYKIDVKKGAQFLFDKNTNKLSLKGTASTIIDKKLIGAENGGFDITFGPDGKPAKIDYLANGIFIDKANIIQATSPNYFSVCLGSRDVTERWCKDSPNSLRINYGSDLNDIVSTGEINYQVGFTKVSAKAGSKTIFEQTPDYNYYFQQVKGSSIIKKDEIEAEVKYISPEECKKIQGTGAAYQIYQHKERCGTIVNVKRTGIPTIVTESINIVDQDKKYGYTIGSEGGINVFNLKTNTKVVGTFNPGEQNLDIKNLWGSRFGSDRLTSTLVADRLIKGMENFKNDKLNPRWYDAFSSINVLERTLPLKGDAILEMDKYIIKVKSFKQYLELGEPIEEAARKAGLPSSFVTTFSQSINYDGSLDTVQSAISAEDMLRQAKNEKNRFVQLGLYENAQLFLDLSNQEVSNGRYGQLYVNLKNKPNQRPPISNILVDNYNIKKYDAVELVNSLESTITNAKKQGKKEILFQTLPSGGSEGSYSYSIAEAEKELARIKVIYNGHQPEFDNLHQTNNLLAETVFWRRTTDFGVEFLTVADLIPIGTALNLGSKASIAIKEAGGIARASREFYTTSSKFIDDILKGEKSLLAVRPALIAERESAELIARRGTFDNIPDLARKFGCMSPCPFDNLASDASKKLLGEIGDNMPGAENIITVLENNKKTITELERKVQELTTAGKNLEAISYFKVAPLNTLEESEQLLVNNIKSIPFKKLENIKVLDGAGNLNDFNNVEIIHGTTVENAESIFIEGISPGMRNAAVPPGMEGRKFVYAEVYNPQITRKGLTPNSYAANLASYKASEAGQNPILIRIKLNELIKDYPNINVRVIQSKRYGETYNFIVFDESSLPFKKIPPKYLELILPVAK